MKTQLLLPIYIIMIIFCCMGCDNDETEPVLDGQIDGTTITLGNGTLKSFVIFDKGTPTTFGVKFNSAALENLPMGDTEHLFSYILEVPKDVDLPPYNHISFDWNEHGHEPPGLYDLPHFDVHFYLISEAERAGIGATDTIQFANQPAAKYIPQEYFQFPAGVPNMGAHWAWDNAPELAGRIFDHTFLYGSYDGEMTFLEPMVTLDFLRTKPDLLLDIKQPEAWQKEGYYPMKQFIHYDASADEYTIALEELVWREKG